MINPALIRGIAIGIAGIIFTIVIGFGARAGYRRAQSTVVFKNTGELVKALDFFKQDNNRFPTATEFGDQNAFGRYLTTGFPLKQLAAGDCNKSYDYLLVNPATYSLTVCLSSSVSSSPAGSHELRP